MQIEDDGSRLTNGRDEENQCYLEAISGRLGSIAGKSPSNGNEPHEVFQPDSSRRDSLRQKHLVGGQATFGKILESLKLIKEQHLSYVKMHQKRLEARLDESKEKETAFLQACDRLEQEIYSLMEEESPDENQ
ncbi:MAG TPA: hypothetical protein VK203_17335 [Nostocaceae cyanobacterium]|nr:hypothetical protein [Nostocaceae cyanobacterium]